MTSARVVPRRPAQDVLTLLGGNFPTIPGNARNNAAADCFCVFGEGCDATNEICYGVVSCTTPPCECPVRSAQRSDAYHHLMLIMLIMHSLTRSYAHGLTYNVGRTARRPWATASSQLGATFASPTAPA